MAKTRLRLSRQRALRPQASRPPVHHWFISAAPDAGAEICSYTPQPTLYRSGHKCCADAGESRLDSRANDSNYARGSFGADDAHIGEMEAELSSPQRA